MNLGEFKSTYESQSNQVVSGSVNTDYFNNAIAYASLAFFKKQAGIEDVPNNGPYWQKCQQVSDSLINFIKVLGEDGNPFLKVNAQGYAVVPSDYFMYSSMVFPQMTSQDASCTMIEKEYEIDMLTDEQFQSRVTSVRKQPTVLKAICTPRSGKLRFAPKNITRVKFVYLRAPLVPFFDWDWVDGVIHYLPPGSFNNGTTGTLGAPSTSVEFEWPDKYHIELYNIMASFLADPLRDQTLKQSTERFKQTGQ